MIPGPVHRCPCGAWTASAQVKCSPCRKASQRASREWQMAAQREAAQIAGAA